MYAVMVVPPSADIGQSATVLAQVAGGSAYDQRQPLLRNLPFLVAWREDPAEVRAIAQQLRQTGVEAWPLSRAALDLTPQAEEARGLTFLPGGLQVRARQQVYSLLAADLGLVLPCRADAGQVTVVTTTTKKVGLAQMAMGIPIAKKVVETEQQREFEQRFFALLWARRADGLNVMFEIQAESMDFAGLGAAKTASSTTNFLTLMERLRQLAPSAWDPRLERAGGKISPISMPQKNLVEKTGRSKTVATNVSGFDTEGAVMQTAHLLVLASRLRGAAAGRPV